MALNFNILNLKQNGETYARIDFNGYKEWYKISGFFKIVYNPWISNPDSRLMICTQQDEIPVNGQAEEMCFKVKGISAEARKLEGDLEKAMFEFIKSQ